MTLLSLLSGFGEGDPLPELNASLAAADLGLYVDEGDVGWHVHQVNQDQIFGDIGILRWGLAQFGTTGILGYSPTSTANFQGWQVERV